MIIAKKIMLVMILAESWPFLVDRKVKWEEERMGLLHSRTVVSMCAQQDTCNYAAHTAHDHSSLHF